MRRQLGDGGLSAVRAHSVRRWLVFCAVASVLAASGCSRTKFRLRADNESYHILEEKTADPRWHPPRIDITPDPRSRFYDQEDLDRPPLPPDDPAAHQYMHNANGIHGWKHWHEFGDLDHLENPMWTTYFDGEPFQGPQFPLPEVKKLGFQEAVEIGLIHSREYQEQLENMYLTALALTFQRYRFAVRPLGFLGEPGTSIAHDHQPDDASNLQLGTTNLGVSKLLPSGAQFVAELANNTIWLFSGPNATQTATSLAYSLTVPLMAGGTREIAMENLTQSERTVLYRIRDFARFRKDFYVTIVTGERALPLPGNTGGAELAFLIRGERSPTVGFYFLLFALQRSRIQETNVRSLETLIRDLEQLSEAGRATSLDITQLKSSLARAKRRYYLISRFYFDQLDRFKVQLGLPPDIEVQIDDSLIQPYQFLNSDLLLLEGRISTATISDETDQWVTTIQEFKSHQTELKRHLDVARQELQQLEDIIPRRSQRLDTADAKQLREDFDQDQQNFADIRTRVAANELQLAALTNAVTNRDDNVLVLMRQVRRGLLRSTRELTSLQIGVRVELVSLPTVDLTLEDAVHLALVNRLDLMNRRGFVMDARRRLEVAADRLEATVNVVAEGSLSTPGPTGNSQPFEFRAKDSNFQAGLEFVTPLDRKQARNNFRAAQISYQRARRNYMGAEDQVKLDVRTLLRNVVAQERVYETNRRGVRVAARELDQAIEFSEQPEAGSRAGNQGLNISRALDNILDAQEELIESWVDYETARLGLYRDMGTMYIDENGFWIEDLDAAEAIPVPMPDEPAYPPPAPIVSPESSRERANAD